MRLLVVLLSLAVAQGSYKLQAWHNLNSTLVWPELSLPEVTSKPNTGISFSGGGARSFTVSVGTLAGLHQQGLMSNVRYIAGISGGSWATVGYTYGTSGNGNDTTLLGAVMAPEMITKDNQQTIAKGCLRGAAVNKNFNEISIGKLLNPEERNDRVWHDTVTEVFFTPYGVKDIAYMAASPDHRTDILARNPTISIDDIVLPNPGRPFPIVGISLLAPKHSSKVPASNRSYTVLEATPLYTGEPVTQSISYGFNDTTIVATVGGMLESVGFTSNASLEGLGSSSQRLLNVSQPEVMFSPTWMGSLSSFAPGAVLSSISPRVTEDLSPIFKYWSPSTRNPVASPFVFADGGDTQNPNLLSLLVRDVKEIVLFCNFNQPLNSTFDPDARNVTKTDMDEDIPAMFGINLDLPRNIFWDVHRNQAFASKDFPAVAKALVAAQNSGKGAVARVALETVANSWYGLKAGIKANVTFVLLGRAPAWEAKLPKDLQSLVVPDKDASNPTVTIDHGELKGFPNFDTLKLHYTPLQANMLANLCGWIIQANMDIFKHALAPAS
eukprot:m.100198 g.100198  ORF g.100198 m.100198 type:complete len:553 (-) comp15118_c0_seq2:1087-2745(-)